MKYEVEKKIEIMGQFSELFRGGLQYDCGRGGKRTYSPDHEIGAKIKTFDASFLSEEEVIALMEKSLKDGINHLFEKVKDYRIILDLKPDCLY